MPPLLELFIVLNEINRHAHEKKVAVNTKHGMKKIHKYDDKIKG